jgi:glycosyltransferase involved in cell wall biosynthesis
MTGQSQLRVCILIPILDIGGAEVQVIDQLRVFDRSGVWISVCCLVPGNPEMESDARRYSDSFFQLGLRRRYLPFAMLRLVRYLKRGRFDVIHCHMPPADWMGRVAGWLAGVPVRITTEHGRGLWKSPLRVLLDRVLNRVTDLRICVSRDILEIRARRERTPKANLEYLPNGVDQEVFRAPARTREDVMGEFGWVPDDRLVVSVGRLVKEKNYTLLVEAVASLMRRDPGVRCVIAGEGPCRGEIDAHIADTDTPENIRLVGARKDIVDLLHAADVFVLSSLREGLPVSLIEAMASGRPIAATDVGGIPDAIENGENGILVPPADVRALSEAIWSLLSDRDFASKLGISAMRTAAEKFSLEHVVRRTKEVYFEIYNRKRA